VHLQPRRRVEPSRVRDGDHCTVVPATGHVPQAGGAGMAKPYRVGPEPAHCSAFEHLDRNWSPGESIHGRYNGNPPGVVSASIRRAVGDAESVDVVIGEEAVLGQGGCGQRSVTCSAHGSRAAGSSAFGRAWRCDLWTLTRPRTVLGIPGKRHKSHEPRSLGSCVATYIWPGRLPSDLDRHGGGSVGRGCGRTQGSSRD
jgi:hypothetical protein